MPENDQYIFDQHSLIAGIVGVLVSLLNRRKQSLKQAAVGFITGGTAVWFAAPPLNAWLNASEQTAALISFIVGLCAVKLAEAAINDPFGLIAKLRKASSD
jgi:hypothetical protein